MKIETRRNYLLSVLLELSQQLRQQGGLLLGCYRTLFSLVTAGMFCLAEPGGEEGVQVEGSPGCQ